MRTGTCAIALAIAALSLSSSAEAHAPRCHSVHARGFGHDHGDGTTDAVLFGPSLLATTRASFTIVDVVNGVASMDGEILVDTLLGELVVPITGSFDLGSGAFHAEGAIASGTALLAGATGELVFDGVEDFASATFVETVTGDVCAPRP